MAKDFHRKSQNNQNVSNDIPANDQTGPVASQSSPISGQSTRPAEQPGGIRVGWRTILGLILLVPAIIFSFVNRQDVELNLIFKTIEAPLILIILCSILIGSVSALLANYRQRRRKEKK